MEQSRGGLVSKADRLLNHSTLGLTEIRRKNKKHWSGGTWFGRVGFDFGTPQILWHFKASYAEDQGGYEGELNVIPAPRLKVSKSRSLESDNGRVRTEQLCPRWSLRQSLVLKIHFALACLKLSPAVDTECQAVLECGFHKRALCSELRIAWAGGHWVADGLGNWGVVVTEVGSYLRLINCCITQLKAQGSSRTYDKSKEEEAGDGLGGE